MMLKYMLDTNIVIHVIKNRPQSARERFIQHQGQIALSSISLMELIYGAENSAHPEHNLREIRGLVARLELLSYDDAAATHTGQIRASQKKAGTPIGPYDQMIAGHARSKGLILVTNNQREFTRVPGLQLDNWV